MAHTFLLNRQGDGGLATRLVLQNVCVKLGSNDSILQGAEHFNVMDQEVGGPSSGGQA